MSIMKDSGTVWLGEIPYYWKISKINSIFELRTQKVSDRDYAPLSVTMQGIVPQLDSAAKTNAHDDRKLVKKGDFAINSRSDRRGSCGISPYNGSVSLINLVMKPREAMNPDYYNWLFHTIQFADEFYKWGHGIVDDLWTTNWQDMKHIDIPVPPIEEQKKIAAFLDSKCEEIDVLYMEIQKDLETLEEYRKSVITQAVTKGLNPDVEMKDSGIEWIGKIPESWDVKRFKYVGIVKSNLVDVSMYQDYPQISPENIGKDSGLLLEYNTVEEAGIISDNHLFYKGQILYSKIRPKLNKATIAPFEGLCSADMYPIETKEETKFVLYMVLSRYFLNQVALVTEDRVKMPKINQDELGRIYIVIPQIEEQKNIVDYLDGKCEEIDGIIEDKKKQLEVIGQYKKSLIYEYVTGKKEVMEYEYDLK